jgi:acyl-coenzyme A thioesterase PaaI-like protein
MDTEKSLQEIYSPGNICFGCGPANPQGLRLRSFPKDDALVAEFRPEPHHQAYAGKLNGGIAGALLDCHCNWMAAWHLMKRLGLESPPCTVTADYKITFLQPTPTDQPLHLRSWLVESTDRKAVTEGSISLSDGTVTAKCVGTFVAVKPGHPAYHRW